MFRFTIRGLLWLTAVVSLACLTIGLAWQCRNAHETTGGAFRPRQPQAPYGSGVRGRESRAQRGA